MLPTRRSKRNGFSDVVPAMAIGSNTYERWIPRFSRRKKKSCGPLPAPPKEALTGWAINCDDWKSDAWVDRVPACVHCFCLRSELPLKPALNPP